MKKQVQDCPTQNAIYGLGFIGAAIYFIMNATSFLTGVAGITAAMTGTGGGGGGAGIFDPGGGGGGA